MITNQFTVFFHSLFLSGSLCHPRQKQLLKLLKIICSLSLAPKDFCIQQQYQKGQDLKTAPHIKQYQIIAMMKYQTQIATNQTVKTILVSYQHPRETDLSVLQWVNWGNQSCSLFFLTDCWSFSLWAEFIMTQLTISNIKMYHISRVLFLFFFWVVYC